MAVIAHGDGLLSGYDALLCMAGNVWKQHRPGQLPDPGEPFIVHHSLPDARVVSVVEPRHGSSCAALLRFPVALISVTAQQQREQALRNYGWARQR